MSGIDKCDANQFSHERSIYCENGWIGDESIIHSTASIDLEMVCSDQWKKSFAQSLYMVNVSLKLIIVASLERGQGGQLTPLEF